MIDIFLFKYPAGLITAVDNTHNIVLQYASSGCCSGKVGDGDKC